MATDDALERLYAVTPKEFTRARNSLAADLRRARKDDAARVVAGLRRPSPALWAVNQLARHAASRLERFLDAVERLRRTQLSDPRAAMDAMRAQRAELEELVARAEQALGEAGYRPSADMRRRIGDTLLGAAVDRRHADAVTHGRLTEELHAPGFDALTGTARLRVVQGGAPRGHDDDSAAAREARRREAADARRREREAKAEVRRREAEARRREAAERAAAVAALEREAQAARERLADVQRRIKQARRGRASRAR